MADADPTALIIAYGRALAAVSAYSLRVDELAAAARTLAEADGSPASAELVRRIDAGEFRWGFHVGTGDESDVAMTNEAIDAGITARLNRAIGRELLAEGNSIVVLDEDGRVVRKDPDGTITPLD